MKDYIVEAFRASNLLEEEDFLLDDQGVQDAKDFLNDDDFSNMLNIIDDEVEEEEEVTDDHMGDVILQCTVCEQLVYKNEDEVVCDEEEELVNIHDECPYCHSTDGFLIVGKVAPFDLCSKENEEPAEESTTENELEAEEEIEIPDAEESEEEVEEEKVEESVEEEEEEVKESVEEDSDETEEELDEGLPAKGVEELRGVDELKHRPEHAGVEELKGVDELKGQYEDNFTEALNLEEECGEEEVKETLDTSTEGEDFDSYENLVHGIYHVLEDAISNPNVSYTDMHDAFEEACTRLSDEHEIHTENLEAEVAVDEELEELEEEKVCEKCGKSPCECEHEEQFSELEEGFENVHVETEDQIMDMSQDDTGKVTVETSPKTSMETEVEGTATIAPLTDEEKMDIESNIEEPEEDEFAFEEPTDEDEFTDLDFDEFDEESFDTMGESYFKENYSNVNSFKTNKAYSKGNQFIIEGIIDFKSGNKKTTQFIFESTEATKSGKVKFIGENAQLSKGKKAFKLTGSINENKLVLESFNYNHTAKDTEGNSVKVSGTVKGNK